MTAHRMLRVVCDEPGELVAALEQLGARVSCPVTVVRHHRGPGLVVERRQASVDLPERDGRVVHLLIADDPRPTPASEWRAKVAAKTGAPS